MHQYLTAIGFGNIKSKKEWNEILSQVENDFNQYAVVSEKDDVAYCEFRKEFAEGIGISLAGTMMTINLNESFTIRILPESESQHMRKL